MASAMNIKCHPSKTREWVVGLGSSANAAMSAQSVAGLSRGGWTPMHSHGVRNEHQMPPIKNEGVGCRTWLQRKCSHVRSICSRPQPGWLDTDGDNPKTVYVYIDRIYRGWRHHYTSSGGGKLVLVLLMGFHQWFRRCYWGCGDGRCGGVYVCNTLDKS